MRQNGRVIKYIQSTSHRTVAALAAAVALSAVASASAQTIDTNIFGGTNAPNPDSISVTSTVGLGQSTTGAVGPGFNGTISLTLGAITTATESINANSNGSLSLSEVGALGVAGNFSASKSFTGSSFAAGQYYQFTLTRSAASTLNALSAVNIALTTTSNGTTTTVLDTSTGTGLLGAANVLNLFGTSNTATFTFQAPANISTTTPINVAITGGLTASALGSNFVFTGGSLQAVPEPGTVASVSMGAFALVMATLRRRRLS